MTSTNNDGDLLSAVLNEKYTEIRNLFNKTNGQVCTTDQVTFKVFFQEAIQQALGGDFGSLLTIVSSSNYNGYAVNGKKRYKFEEPSFYSPFIENMVNDPLVTWRTHETLDTPSSKYLRNAIEASKLDANLQMNASFQDFNKSLRLTKLLYDYISKDNLGHIVSLLKGGYFEWISIWYTVFEHSVRQALKGFFGPLLLIFAIDGILVNKFKTIDDRVIPVDTMFTYIDGIQDGIKDPAFVQYVKDIIQDSRKLSDDNLEHAFQQAKIIMSSERGTLYEFKRQLTTFCEAHGIETTVIKSSTTPTIADETRDKFIYCMSDFSENNFNTMNSILTTSFRGGSSVLYKNYEEGWLLQRNADGQSILSTAVDQAYGKNFGPLVFLVRKLCTIGKYLPFRGTVDQVDAFFKQYYAQNPPNSQNPYTPYIKCIVYTNCKRSGTYCDGCDQTYLDMLRKAFPVNETQPLTDIAHKYEIFTKNLKAFYAAVDGQSGAVTEIRVGEEKKSTVSTLSVGPKGGGKIHRSILQGRKSLPEAPQDQGPGHPEDTVQVPYLSTALTPTRQQHTVLSVLYGLMSVAFFLGISTIKTIS